MTKIVNIKHGDKYDIYIGRPGHGKDGYFGNEHPIGFCKKCNRIHDRDDCINEFKKDFDKRIKEDIEFKNRVDELKDKVLGCFCKEKHREVRCHGDIYCDYHNNMSEETIKKYKVCITGSSSFGDKKLLFDYLDSKIDKIEQIVVGSCRDLDKICSEWVSIRGKVLVKFFSKIDEDTGMLTKGGHLHARREMIKYSDIIIILDNKSSEGAKFSKEIAEQLNKKIKIIEF